MAKVKSNMYTLNLSLDIREELLSKWCSVRGYTQTISQLNSETNEYETVPNPETEIQFFERLVKNEILSIAIYPIQNAIINEANQLAQTQSQQIREMAENSLKIKVENTQS